VSADTFVRLIYAGNAVSTVQVDETTPHPPCPVNNLCRAVLLPQSSDNVKLITVRMTNFEPAAVGAAGSPGKCPTCLGGALSGRFRCPLLSVFAAQLAWMLLPVCTLPQHRNGFGTSLQVQLQNTVSFVSAAVCRQLYAADATVSTVNAYDCLRWRPPGAYECQVSREWRARPEEWRKFCYFGDPCGRAERSGCVCHLCKPRQKLGSVHTLITWAWSMQLGHLERRWTLATCQMTCRQAQYSISAGRSQCFLLLKVSGCYTVAGGTDGQSCCA
jgi:hypothetical protein